MLSFSHQHLDPSNSRGGPSAVFTGIGRRYPDIIKNNNGAIVPPNVIIPGKEQYTVVLLVFDPIISITIYLENLTGN